MASVDEYLSLTDVYYFILYYFQEDSSLIVQLLRKVIQVSHVIFMNIHFAVCVDRRECRRGNRKKVTAIWAQNEIARLPSVEFMNYYSSWCNNSTVHLDWNTVL